MWIIQKLFDLNEARQEFCLHSVAIRQNQSEERMTHLTMMVTRFCSLPTCLRLQGFSFKFVAKIMNFVITERSRNSVLKWGCMRNFRIIILARIWLELVHLRVKNNEWVYSKLFVWKCHCNKYSSHKHSMMICHCESMIKWINLKKSCYFRIIIWIYSYWKMFEQKYIKIAQILWSRSAEEFPNPNKYKQL